MRTLGIANQPTTTLTPQTGRTNYLDTSDQNI
jgi:hypothetical protein